MSLSSCRSIPVSSSSEHKLRYFWWNLRAQWVRTLVKQSMWHQGLNFNFVKLREYYFVRKQKTKITIYSIILLRVTVFRNFGEYHNTCARFPLNVNDADTLGTLQLRCCLWRVRELSDFIKSILICVRRWKTLRAWNDMGSN